MARLQQQCGGSRYGRCAAVTTKLFGEPVRRREDARLIVGKGRYLDDIGPDRSS